MYEYIVLSGGAIKGLAYIGVYQYLQEHNMIKNIKEFVGCSIGAFASLLMILGYKPSVIKDIFNEFNLDSLKSFNICSFSEKYGLDNGEKITKFIKVFIKNKNFDENITLKDFNQKTGKKLITVTTNINTKKTEFMTEDKFPDIPVYLAVQMSMTVPVIYQPIKYLDGLYVDGCLTCNFPIRYYEYFDEEKKKNILTFSFQEENQNTPVANIHEYLYNVLLSSFATIYNIDNKYFSGKIKNVIIPVNVYTNFNLQISEDKRDSLYKSGYDSCVISFTDTS